MLELTSSSRTDGGDGKGGGGGDGIRNQALGGPSVEFEPSVRAYVSSHAVAPSNILSASVTELVSHAEMSALNDVADLNMNPMSVTELVSHAEMSALNDVALENMDPMSVTELVSHAEMSALNAVASAKHGPHVRHRPGVPRVHVTRLTCLVNIGQAVIDSSLEVIC